MHLPIYSSTYLCTDPTIYLRIVPTVPSLLPVHPYTLPLSFIQHASRFSVALGFTNTVMFTYT